MLENRLQYRLGSRTRNFAELMGWKEPMPSTASRFCAICTGLAVKVWSHSSKKKMGRACTTPSTGQVIYVEYVGAMMQQTV